MTAQPILSLEHLAVGYSRRVVLPNVNLTLQRGSFTGLVGANGSGKSTLLRLLDGLHAPKSGTLRVFGETVENVDTNVEAAHRFHRRVGLVFQDPDVQLFSPTVGDDVAFGPLQLNLPLREVRERVEDALRQMDIIHLRDRAPFELSGGEKKRAAIASVLSLEPTVILLDEPTASLDPRTKWVLVNLIQEMGKQGKTIVTATHDLEVVPLIADRVVVLGEERRVIADGPAREILADDGLLIHANLIHEHLHQHATLQHAHAHAEGHHEIGHPEGEAGT